MLPTTGFGELIHLAHNRLKLCNEKHFRRYRDVTACLSPACYTANVTFANHRPVISGKRGKLRDAVPLGYPFTGRFEPFH